MSCVLISQRKGQLSIHGRGYAFFLPSKPLFALLHLLTIPEARGNDVILKR